MRGLRRRALVAMALVGVMAATAACGDDEGGSAEDARPAGSFPDWPAPDDPMERAEGAGLTPSVKEDLAVHRHSHLDVFVDGEPVTVPAAIGIDITDPGVKEFPDGSYGGIEECEQPCISPLHTHTDSGIIHTEAATGAVLLTLGQLFTEWGVELDDECVGEFCDDETDIAVYIGRDEYDGDPAEIELEDQRVIVIVIGIPPDRIPDRADFSQE